MFRLYFSKKSFLKKLLFQINFYGELCPKLISMRTDSSVRNWFLQWVKDPKGWGNSPSLECRDIFFKTAIYILIIFLCICKSTYGIEEKYSPEKMAFFCFFNFYCTISIQQKSFKFLFKYTAQLVLFFLLPIQSTCLGTNIRNAHNQKKKIGTKLLLWIILRSEISGSLARWEVFLNFAVFASCPEGVSSMKTTPLLRIFLFYILLRRRKGLPFRIRYNIIFSLGNVRWCMSEHKMQMLICKRGRFLLIHLYFIKRGAML